MKESQKAALKGNSMATLSKEQTVTFCAEDDGARGAEEKGGKKFIVWYVLYPLKFFKLKAVTLYKIQKYDLK